MGDSSRVHPEGLGEVMNISDAIAALEKRVPNPREGLPDDIFYYISRHTALVNVDLLIKDETGRTLLAWRNDVLTGTGWHLPGGIVRFKETLESRVRKVAETEVGVPVEFDPKPLVVNQIIHPRQDIRGHFISILYRCSLASTFVPDNKGRSASDPGYLMWHDSCPDNLLDFHEIYRDFI
jgi:colanic acid biosynthesis protein WcaH